MEEDEDQMPELTEWNYLCCIGCPCTYIQDKRKRYFFRYWEIHGTMPVIVSGLVLFAYFTYLYAVCPDLPSKASKLSSLIIISVSMIMFFVCYFLTMCMDPGFLPFNWHDTKKSFYTWQEQISGLAYTEDQFKWVNDHEKPPTASFSKSSGRYVLRADHICGWIGNWIGKRNYKQFMLMALYGAIFTDSIFITRFVPQRNLKLRSKNLYSCDISIAVLTGLFGLILTGQFIACLIDVIQNVTQINKWKNTERKKIPIIQAFRNICGDSFPLFWICPYPAFPKDFILENNI